MPSEPTQQHRERNGHSQADAPTVCTRHAFRGRTREHPHGEGGGESLRDFLDNSGEDGRLLRKLQLADQEGKRHPEKACTAPALSGQLRATENRCARTTLRCVAPWSAKSETNWMVAGPSSTRSARNSASPAP